MFGLKKMLESWANRQTLWSRIPLTSIHLDVDLVELGDERVLQPVDDELTPNDQNLHGVISYLYSILDTYNVEICVSYANALLLEVYRWDWEAVLLLNILWHCSVCDLIVKAHISVLSFFQRISVYG